MRHEKVRGTRPSPDRMPKRYQQMIKGLVLLAAVFIDMYQKIKG